jgi:hypothetical protein
MMSKTLSWDSSFAYTAKDILSQTTDGNFRDPAKGDSKETVITPRTKASQEGNVNDEEPPSVATPPKKDDAEVASEILRRMGDSLGLKREELKSREFIRKETISTLSPQKMMLLPEGQAVGSLPVGSTDEFREYEYEEPRNSRLSPKYGALSPRSRSQSKGGSKSPRGGDSSNWSTKRMGFSSVAGSSAASSDSNTKGQRG